MSITRRALLGTLIGFPLGIKAAQGKSPEIGDIEVTAIKGFSKQRIEDIGDAFLTLLEQHLIFKEARYTEMYPDIHNADLSAFLIPSADDKISIRDLELMFAWPAVAPLVRTVIEQHASKYRYAGVVIKRNSDGSLFVQLVVSHEGEKPDIPKADYSKWQRAL